MLNFFVDVNKLRCDEKFCFNLELIFHDASRHKLGRALFFGKDDFIFLLYDWY